MHQDKPLILFFPFNLLSHYLRCIELANSIRDTHRVLFAGSPKYNSFIEQHDYEHFDCENYNAEEMIDCASRFDFSWINESSIERIMLSQVKCINELKPDLVIGDGVNTLKMAAEITGVKFISLMNGYMTKHYSLVRDVPSGHPAAKYSKQIPPEIYSTIIRFAESLAFRQVHKPFKRTRKKYKLKKLRIFPDEMEGDINLILDLHELFPQKQLPANYVMTGPLFYSGNDSSEYIKSERPVILVSMGSSGNWKGVAFLNDEVFSAYHIIAAGDHERVLKADHVTHYSFISGDNTWKDVRLVICHGGNGTVYQALSRGIPVLCRTYLFEQEYNARRVEAMGLGKCINDVSSAESLKRMVDEWSLRKNDEISAKISVEETKKRFAEVMRREIKN